MYTGAKTYCPISMLSFTLKTMDKLVDRHMRDEILGLHPPHQYQFAHQPRKSSETTLHHVITHIEEAVEKREVTFGAFPGIERALDIASIDIITKVAKQHGLPYMTSQWISSMLGGRKITAMLAGKNLEGSAARSCPAGGCSIASAVGPGCGQTHRRTQ